VTVDREELQATIHGKVQGVSFRFAVYEWAVDLGLTGYVTNQPDGSIIIVAQGSREKLEQLIGKCYDGPLSN